MDGTPILDIKPYLPFTDSHPNAKAGFTQHTGGHRLAVEYAPGLWEKVPCEKREALTQVLAQDPRPAYQDDPGLCTAWNLRALRCISPFTRAFCG